ncbi:MAG: hypothetical protein ACOC8E_06880 [Planctomycetota bacterium]
MCAQHDRLIRYLVALTREFEPHVETVLDPKSGESIYQHDNNANLALAFLALYRDDHPENPYGGEPRALDIYRKLVGGWVKKWEEAGETYRFPEWPIFIMCCGLDLAGEELGADLAGRIRRLVLWYVERDLRRPFFFTAPNHEVWKLAGAALAGRLLDRPDWREQAGFEAEQMIGWQTDEGFWEEGRHHGPSMKYNFVMLAGLATLARELANDRLIESARRLARFVARWVFPDGVTVGALDGRRTTGPTGACPGLELVPEGVALMDRALAFWDRTGWLDPALEGGPLQRGAMKNDWRSAAWLIYRTRWLGEDVAGGSEPAELPTERAGKTLQNHTPTFDGVLRRQGPWCVGLSGQLSDVPKDTLFIYRLERQSRIELWHERASVVVGGGHNPVTADRPRYNAWVDPGYRVEPAGYAGKAETGPGSAEMARRRSMYYPRAASTGTDGETSWLELVFAHATVRFEVEPHADGLAIRYSYRAAGVEELRVALPLVVWEGGRVLADGRPVEPATEPARLPVERRVTVEQALFDAAATLAVPDVGRTRVIFPLGGTEPGYGPAFLSLAFVETVLETPGREGAGEWRLEVSSHQ